MQVEPRLRHVVERQHGNARVPEVTAQKQHQRKAASRDSQMSALCGNAVDVAVQTDGKFGLVGGRALPALAASHFACIWVANLTLRRNAVSLQVAA